MLSEYNLSTWNDCKKVLPIPSKEKLYVILGCPYFPDPKLRPALATYENSASIFKNGIKIDGSDRPGWFYNSAIDSSTIADKIFYWKEVEK